MHPMKKILLLVACVALSGCLKTRSQLKEESSEGNEAITSSAPVPAQVKEVAPPGQYVLDEIKSEITRMTGRIEDLERNNHQQNQQSLSTSKEELKKLETRIIELEQAQVSMLEALKKLQANAPTPEMVEFFEKGKALFHSKDFEGALESFTHYLKNPKAKHIEDATYLRGEAYFQLKNFKKAIIEFSKFPEKYHQSKKLPAAFYRIGLAFDALGMKDDAKGFYQELIEKFPKSPEAQKARAKLK